MRIAIGSDHAGWKLKQYLIDFLAVSGHMYNDFGCYSEDTCDYPDVAQVVSEAVAQGQYDRGILVCNTGNGMCMTANKVSGIRAVLCHDSRTGRLAREHNDANVLCLGQGTVDAPLAREITHLFLTTGFAGERHARRIGKIAAMEKR